MPAGAGGQPRTTAEEVSMLRQLSVLALALVPLAGCSGSKRDKEAMQGMWEVVSSEEGGQPPKESWKKSRALIDSEINLFNLIGTDPPTRIGLNMKRLDAAKSPKEIDLEMDGSPRPGIYELKGNDLKICYDQDGKTRPTEFKTKEGDRFLLLVLKRKA
jgi:uncharacterized protein (TIGR03067 family)